MAFYVYGLMRAEDGARAVDALSDASLEAIEHGEICALVTGVGEGDLRLRFPGGFRYDVSGPFKDQRQAGTQDWI